VTATSRNGTAFVTVDTAVVSAVRDWTADAAWEAQKAASSPVACAARAACAFWSVVKVPAAVVSAWSRVAGAAIVVGSTGTG
jgi:hypothetical protein